MVFRRYHPVCHDVQVRMFLVCVTAYNILGVHNAHALHVLGRFRPSARQSSGRVSVRAKSSEMWYTGFFSFRRLVVRLPLHTSCDSALSSRRILTVYKPCLFRVVHVVHQPCEARPFFQVAHHICVMIFVELFQRLFSLWFWGSPVDVPFRQLVQVVASSLQHTDLLPVSSCVRAATTLPWQRQFTQEVRRLLHPHRNRFMTKVFHSASEPWMGLSPRSFYGLGGLFAIVILFCVIRYCLLGNELAFREES